jgi:type IV secretion system protein TrbL
MPALGLCGGPLQPVCDVVGGVAGSVGDAASSAVLGGLGTAFVSAAGMVAQTALTALDASTSIDLGADWFTRNLAVMAIITLPVVVGLFVLQVILAVLHREPGGLIRAVVGTGKAMLGAGIAVAVTQSLLVACDQICTYIAAASGTTVTGAAKRFIDLTWLAGPTAGPVLQMLLGIVLIVGFLLLWAVMLFRKAALLLVVMFAPIAFAGSVFDHTRAWTRRWIEVVAALVACKVVIVVVFVVGASAFGGVGPTATGGGGTAPASASGSLSDILVGALLLTIATFAPWLTWRFLHWSGMEAASVMHSTIAASPVPSAVRSAAGQAQSTTQRAVTSMLLGAATGGAGAAAGAAGGAGTSGAGAAATSKIPAMAGAGSSPRASRSADSVSAPHPARPTRVPPDGGNRS